MGPHIHSPGRGIVGARIGGGRKEGNFEELYLDKLREKRLVAEQSNAEAFDATVCWLKEHGSEGTWKAAAVFQHAWQQRHHQQYIYWANQAKQNSPVALGGANPTGAISMRGIGVSRGKAGVSGMSRDGSRDSMQWQDEEQWVAGQQLQMRASNNASPLSLGGNGGGGGGEGAKLGVVGFTDEEDDFFSDDDGHRKKHVAFNEFNDQQQASMQLSDMSSSRIEEDKEGDGRDDRDADSIEASPRLMVKSKGGNLW